MMLAADFTFSIIGGNEALQLFGPVEDDVDLCGSARLRRDRHKHQEPLAVGADIVKWKMES